MAKPADKSPEMQQFLEDGFGWKTAITNDICSWCKGPAAEFKDKLSEREYSISGFYQKCQDDVYGE